MFALKCMERKNELSKLDLNEETNVNFKRSRKTTTNRERIICKDKWQFPLLKSKLKVAH